MSHYNLGIFNGLYEKKRYFDKKITYALCLLLNLSFVDFLYASAPQATIAPDSHNQAIFKKIAQSIIGKVDQIPAIEKKLKEFHSPSAKLLWQTYFSTSKTNTFNINNPNEIHTSLGAFKAHINTQPQYSADLKKAKTSTFESIVVKTPNTFYTDAEITGMAQTIQDAVAQGIYGPNPGGQGATPSPYNFIVTYTHAVGERCTKTNNATQCQAATNMIIVFEAKDYIEALSHNPQHSQDWNAQPNIKGKIVTINSEL